MLGFIGTTMAIALGILIGGFGLMALAIALALNPNFMGRITREYMEMIDDIENAFLK